MDTNTIATTLGALVGLILGLTGAGGGILAVPLLFFGLHLPMIRAIPVGLIAVGLAAAFGAVLGLRDGLVRYRAAALIGIIGMALAPVGVLIAQHIPNEPLTLTFALVLALVALQMMNSRATVPASSNAKELPCVRNPQSGRLVWTLPCGRMLAATGVASGLASGLLGVGGGFIIVPSLNRFTDLDTRSVLATSLAVIAVVSVGGVGAAALQGSIAWDIAVPFSAGAVTALIVGRRIAAALNPIRLRQAFSAASLFVAALMVCKAFGWMPTWVSS